jgi:RNA polymerase sigma-70 factor, ECF subfamily
MNMKTITAPNLGTFTAEPIASLATSERTDEELVSAFLADGDARYFETLVRRYERELFAFLRRFLGNIALAEDCFQATFITVHQRLNQFEQGRRFRPWLYAVATNKAIDMKRQSARRPVLSLDSVREDASGGHSVPLSATVPSREEDPRESAVSQETASCVREAMSQLSEPTQLLLNLAFYQGMKYADIAEILGVPVGTVKSRVFNAMRKLNDYWRRKQWSEPS